MKDQARPNQLPREEILRRLKHARFIFQTFNDSALSERKEGFNDLEYVIGLFEPGADRRHENLAPPTRDSRGEVCCVCGKEVWLGGCSGCGWSQGMCKCDPVFRCAKCGVVKKYHDDPGNVMTNDHGWVDERESPTKHLPHRAQTGRRPETPPCCVCGHTNTYFFYPDKSRYFCRDCETSYLDPAVSGNPFTMH